MEGAVRNLWGEARELMGLQLEQEESRGRGGGGGGGGAQVQRLESPPSSLVFLRDYVSANRPVVISAAATRHWPAISQSLWSRDSYLCRALRGSTVSLHLTPHGRADSLVPIPTPTTTHTSSSLCFASACVLPVDFSEALHVIEDTADDGGGIVAYAQQQDDCLRGEYAAISGDVDPHIPWATEALGCLPDAVNLWIGNGRSHTCFHKDHYDNLYAVVSGEKHFTLLPPTEVHRLYVRPYPAARYIAAASSPAPASSKVKELTLRLQMEEPARQVPWCSVDPYPASPEAMAMQMSSFPLYFQGPEPIRCTVKAGEILYLPSMWFHHVRQTPDSNGRTIAVNYWYDMQFDIKYAYFNFLHSLDPTNQPAADHCIDPSDGYDEGEGELLVQ